MKQGTHEIKDALIEALSKMEDFPAILVVAAMIVNYQRIAKKHIDAAGGEAAAGTLTETERHQLSHLSTKEAIATMPAVIKEASKDDPAVLTMAGSITQHLQIFFEAMEQSLINYIHGDPQVLEEVRKWLATRES